MSGVDDLFGSEDDEPVVQAPAAPTAKPDIKARLAALAEAKRKERVSTDADDTGQRPPPCHPPPKRTPARCLCSVQEGEDPQNDRKPKKQKQKKGVVDFGDDDDEEDGTAAGDIDGSRAGE
jgi:hypothetical protein